MAVPKPQKRHGNGGLFTGGWFHPLRLSSKRQVKTGLSLTTMASYCNLIYLDNTKRTGTTQPTLLISRPGLHHRTPSRDNLTADG
jgi:hypothetical protein